MKFLWLDINASYSHSSLALPALHAQLPKALIDNTEWNIVSGTVKTSKNEIITQCLDFRPNFIFATGWLFNINYLLETLARLNSLININGIFLGGPQFLGDNEHFLRTNNFISAVFKGEGEDMFPSFIYELNKSSLQWQDIEGFEFIKDNNYKQSNIVKVKNFSSLIPPDNSVFFNWNKAFVQLETSRGCFNSCKFCVSGIEKDVIQNISIGDLRERINNIKKKGIKEIRILDRTFNASSYRAVQLLNLFEEFANDIQFHIEVHPAFISKEFKDTISSLSAGLLHIEVGIQSLRNEVINLSGRKGDCNKAFEGLKFLLSLNKFVVHADLIAGLPKYTYLQLVEDTITLMSSNVGEIQLELLKLLPGTVFRNRANDFGIKFSLYPPYEVLETESISFEQLEKASILSKALDSWYNDISWRNVFTKMFSNVEHLQLLIEFLKEKKFHEQTLSYESKALLLYEFCCRFSQHNADVLSIQWIRNGLSLKKKPAEKIIIWSPKLETQHPFIVDKAKDCKIYYYPTQGETYWFLFNPLVKRNCPAMEIIVSNK